MKKNDQITCTCFLAKYGGLYIYDIYFQKIYSIDDEDIHFVKLYGYALIVNPYHPHVTSPDNEYYSFTMDFSTEYYKLTRIQILH